MICGTRTKPQSRAGDSEPNKQTGPLPSTSRAVGAGRRGSAHVVHWLDTSSDPAIGLIGYAQLDPRDGSVQLADPDHRRQGIGRALAEQIIATDHLISWWAFGNLPGAQALASALGLRR